jgi:hypothetical protein
MASLKIRITCLLLLALIMVGCNSAAPAEPAAASSETELTARPVEKDIPAVPPAPAAAQPAQPAVEPANPPPPADKPAAAPSPLCDELCTRTAQLKCGAVDDCKAGCREMAHSDLCGKELRAMLECIAGQPIKSFECDPNTRAPAIRDGFCGTEQSAAADCISRIAEPSAP